MAPPERSRDGGETKSPRGGERPFPVGGPQHRLEAGWGENHGRDVRSTHSHTRCIMDRESDTTVASAVDPCRISTDHKKTAINGLATLRRFFQGVQK